MHNSSLAQSVMVILERSCAAKSALVIVRRFDHFQWPGYRYLINHISSQACKMRCPPEDAAPHNLFDIARLR